MVSQVVKLSIQQQSIVIEFLGVEGCQPAEMHMHVCCLCSICFEWVGMSRVGNAHITTFQVNTALCIMCQRRDVGTFLLCQWNFCACSCTGPLISQDGSHVC